MASPEDDPLLMSTETAARIRVTPTTLKVWRHRNQGPPFYRYGRRVVYRASEVDAWVRSHRVGGDASDEVVAAGA